MGDADDDVRLMIERKSPYLAADDLLDQDACVVITKVVGGIVDDPKSGSKTRKAIVHLKGWEKPLACNITNARVIAALHGSFKASAWVGKRIILYPTTTRLKGETVPCIRVRNRKPEGAAIPQSALLSRPTASSGARPAPSQPPGTLQPDSQESNHSPQSTGRQPGED